MWHLGGDRSRSYLGRSDWRPGSRACPKARAVHAQVTRCRLEVCRGHSIRPPWSSKARRERASTYPQSLAQEQTPYGDLDAARQRIQWLESWRQREDLKLVLNRRMRTRMYGGVGGGPGSRALSRFRAASACETIVGFGHSRGIAIWSATLQFCRTRSHSESWNFDASFTWSNNTQCRPIELDTRIGSYLMVGDEVSGHPVFGNSAVRKLNQVSTVPIDH